MLDFRPSYESDSARRGVRASSDLIKPNSGASKQPPNERMQLTWLIGAPSRPASVHRRAFGQHGLGSPATQLMRAVSPHLRWHNQLDETTVGNSMDSFCFPDATLQQALIRRIRDGGHEVEVLADGSVPYSPRYNLEDFIDEIVRIVFPDTHYRTKITNERLAQRYRGFKSSVGTAYIEERRRGEVHFVQSIYEKHYKSKGIPTHVSLVLADPDLDPQSMSEVLAISPTYVCAKGQIFAPPTSRRRRDARPQVSSRGYWEMSSVSVIESNDVEPHIAWLAEQLKPAMVKLALLPDRLAPERIGVVYVTVVRRDTGVHTDLPSPDLAVLARWSKRVSVWELPDDFVGGR